MTERLKELDERVNTVRLEAFAPSTRKTRESQWKVFENFCIEYDLRMFPITTENVCRFLVWKSSTVKFVTLNNYVSALNVLCKINLLQTNLREDYSVELTMRGLRRILGDKSTPMDPLFPRELKLIAKLVDFSKFDEHATWVGILLAFRTLLRKSHFFSEGEDNIHLLSRNEIQWRSWGLVIIISRSKTIQFGQRNFQAPINETNDILCPCRALKRFWQKYPAPPAAPVLCDRSQKPVKYRKSLTLLKGWCRKANIMKTVGLHSLRRGMATYMRDCGFSLLDIQSHGDWQSLAVLRYLSTSSERRCSIDKSISNNILHVG